MAGFFANDGSVRYRLSDGQPTWFEMHDEYLYDVRTGVVTPGWKTRLRAFLHEHDRASGYAINNWLAQQED